MSAIRDSSKLRQKFPRKVQEKNSNNPAEDLISLAEAARISGYHPDYLSSLCRSGKLQGKKIGRNWTVASLALQSFTDQQKGLVGATQEPSVAINIPEVEQVSTEELVLTDLDVLKRDVFTGLAVTIESVETKVQELGNLVEAAQVDKVGNSKTAMQGNFDFELPVEEKVATEDSQDLSNHRISKLYESFSRKPSSFPKLAFGVFSFIALCISVFVFLFSNSLWFDWGTRISSSPIVYKIFKTNSFQNSEIPSSQSPRVLGDSVAVRYRTPVPLTEDYLRSYVDSYIKILFDNGTLSSPLSLSQNDFSNTQPSSSTPVGAIPQSGVSAQSGVPSNNLVPVYIPVGIAPANTATGSSGSLLFSATNISADSFIGKNLNITESASVKNLTVTGSLNADISGLINPNFSTGSIAFQGSTGLAQDAGNFVWDDTNNSLGIGTNAPIASAVLDVTSSTKGFLMPRMTAAQRDLISSPATGLIVYNTDSNQYNFWNGSAWTIVASGSISSALSGLTAATTDATLANSANNIVWNWQLTGAESGFTFGESAASTGGSNDQNILQVSTLVNSTAIPLYIKNLGNGRSFQLDDSAADTTPFVVDAIGNVGVGTTTPTAKIEIQTGAAGTKGEVIKANSGQTVNLMEFQNNSGTLTSGVDANGRFQIGTNAPTTAPTLYGGNAIGAVTTSEIFTDLSPADSYIGLRGNVQFNPSGAGSYGGKIAYGVFGEAVSLGTQNLGSISGGTFVAFPVNTSGTLTSAYGSQSRIETYSSAPITNAYGSDIQVVNYGVAPITNAIGANIAIGAFGGAVTNATALQLVATTSATAVTNSIGLDIKDFSGTGTSSAYNIRSRGATSQNYFEGTISIGTSTNSSSVYIKGAGATSATSALNITNSAGTSVLFARNDTVLGIGTTSPVSLVTIGSGTPTTAASGLNFGTDTSANLYRSAAATIKTDGTLNAVSGIQLNGTSINTAGTLSNVAYLNQSNTFSTSQTIAPGTAVTALTITQPNSATGISITKAGSGNAINISGTSATAGGVVHSLTDAGTYLMNGTTYGVSSTLSTAVDNYATIAGYFSASQTRTGFNNGDLAIGVDAVATSAISTAGTYGYAGRLTAGSANVVPLLLKGASSQTSDLLQVQNSSGTALSYIDSAGRLFLPSSSTGASNAGLNFGTVLGQHSIGWDNVYGGVTTRYASVAELMVTTNSLYVPSGSHFKWSAGTIPTGGTDLGITRGAARVLRVTDGSTGSGKLTIGSSSAGTTSRLTVATDLTASAWGTAGIQIQAAAATYTDSSTAGSGTATNAVFNSFGRPTLAATNSSVFTTNAATLYIENSPLAGTNQSITNPYALWVDDGHARFDGNVFIGQTATNLNPLAKLNVSEASASNTSSYGQITFVDSNHTGAKTAIVGSYINTNNNSTGSVSGMYGFQGQVLQYGNGTTTDAAAFYAQGSDILNGTVTNDIGLLVGGRSGGTNNYGIQILQNSGANNYAIYSSGTAKSYFAGNVGIGTTTPGQPLHVIGNIQLGSVNNSSGATPGVLRFNGGSGTTDYAGNINFYGEGGSLLTSIKHYGGNWSNENIVFNFNQDSNYNNYQDLFTFSKFGIFVAGQSGGAYQGQIKSYNTSAGAETVPIVLGNMSTSANSNSAIAFDSYSGGTYRAKIVAETPTGTNVAGNLNFYTNNGTTLASKMLIRSDGNVGIGTSSPNYPLEVNGYIRAGTTGSYGTRIFGDSSGGFIAFGTIASPTSLGQMGPYSALFNIDSNNNSISFKFGGTEKARIDSVTGNLGIGTTAPDGRLEIAGNLSTSAWGLNGIQLQGTAATYTDTSSSGTVTNAVANSFAQPTFAASSATTYTNAASLYIANAPAAGTNVSITNPYALWVDNGNVQFDGNLNVNGTITAAGSSIAGNLNPSADNTYDLGTTALRWKTLHVGPGSVVVHNDATNTDKVALQYTSGLAELVSSSAALEIRSGKASGGTTSEALSINTTNTLGSADEVLQVKNNTTNLVTVLGNGNVGVGTPSPSAFLHVVGTTEQQRLGYDASRYVSTTVASNGLVTLQNNPSVLSGNVSMFTFRPTAGAASGAYYIANFANENGTSVATISQTGAITSAASSINLGGLAQAFNVSTNGGQSNNNTPYFPSGIGVGFGYTPANNSTNNTISTRAASIVARGVTVLQLTGSDYFGITDQSTGSGADLLRFTSGGNLGVGTTSPGSKLHVVSNAVGNTSTDGFILENQTAATSGQQQWSPRIRLTGQGWRTNATASSKTLDWIMENQTTSASNSGIGSLVWSYQTSNVPGYNQKLAIIPTDTDGTGTTVDVFGSSPMLRIRSTSEANGLQIGASTGSYRYIQSYESQPLYINNAGNNVILNGTSGNVGIGTTSPSKKLHLQVTGVDNTYTSAMLINQSSDIGVGAGTGIDFGNSNRVRIGEVYSVIDGGGASFVVSNSVDGGSNYTERMRLSEGGRLGIGTAAPDAVLELAGNRSQSAWGFNGVQLQGTAATYTDTSSSGTVANAVANSFGVPTFAASSSTTYSNAANLYIAGAPSAGTNVTVTKGYGLWSNNGPMRVDDSSSTTWTAPLAASLYAYNNNYAAYIKGANRAIWIESASAGSSDYPVIVAANSTASTIGTIGMGINGLMQMGIGNATVALTPNAQIHAVSGSATRIVGQFEGAASNSAAILVSKSGSSGTGDLLQLQNSSGTSLTRADSGGLVYIGSGQTDGGTGALLNVATGIYTPGFVWGSGGFRISASNTIDTGGASNSVRITGSGGLQLVNGGPYVRNVSSTGIQIIQGDNATIGNVTAATLYGGTGTSSTLTLAGTSNGSPSNAYVILNGSGQGYVGIGTTTPTANLDINTTNNVSLQISSNNTAGTAIRMNNSTSGAHNYEFYITGSANSAGKFGVYDATINNTPLAIYGGSSSSAGQYIQTSSNAVIGWSNTATSAALTADTGFSRLAANKIAIGNGTQGDYTGTLVTGGIGIGSTTPGANLDVVSAATTGIGQLITASSVTTGQALSLVGPTSTGVTGTGFLKVASDVGSGGTQGMLAQFLPDYSAGTASNGYGLVISATDSTSVANSDNNLYSSLAMTGNAAKTGFAFYGTVSSNSTVADTSYGANFDTSITGAISTGTRNTIGVRGSPVTSGANTGGTTQLFGGYFLPSSTGSTTGSTVNVFGNYISNTATLTTGGTINSYGLYVANGTSSTTGTSAKYGIYVESPTGADANYAAIFAGGNVGIGTSTPGAALGINGDIMFTDDANREITIGGATARNLTIHPSGNVNAAGALYLAGGVSGTDGGNVYIDGGFGENYGYVILQSSASGANVGIGTTTPSKLLDVQGELQINLLSTQTSVALCGSHSAGSGANVTNVTIVDCTGTPAADYTEMYPVAEDSEVGDVMAVGEDMINTYDINKETGNVDWEKVKGQITKLVKTSTTSNKIIGIVSDNYADFSSTGYNIKEQDNPKAIALNGRVPVKVTNENGEIKPGDYLTLSKKFPGHAVKAVSEGEVIGRALEAFERDSEYTGSDISSGKVMMFINITTYIPTIADMLQKSEKSAVTQDGFLNEMVNLNMTNASVFGSLVVKESLYVAKDIHVKGIVYVAEIKTEKISAKQLCLEEVCVNKEQLQQMLQMLNQTQSQNNSGSGNTNQSTPEQAVEPKDPTPIVVDEVAPPKTESAPVVVEGDNQSNPQP